MLDPTTGRLWCSYGTFFGFIRLVELDPKTGARVEGNQALNIAIDCEGTGLAYHDGWYYLIGTHGTCCSGASSTYNIVAGRSKSVTGPYIDNMGVDMLMGGGKFVVGANNRHIGAGHFGLTDLGDGVQKFSCHYEADLDRGGSSILDVRALLWKDGWPVAGEDFKGGTFEIQSQRSGFVLQLGVEGVTVGGGRGGMRGGAGGAPGGRGGAPGGAAPGAAPGGFGAPGASVQPRTTGEPIVMVGAGDPGAGAPAPAAGARAGGMGGCMGGGGMGGGFGGGMGMGGRGGGAPIPNQDVATISPNWPAGNLEVRLGEYMLQVHQRWSITAVTNAPGFLGSPAFRISIAGTERTLTATADREVIAAPAFTGSPEQLWRIDQLTDGTYRIMPKSVPNTTEPLVLTAMGGSTPTLAKFDLKSDKSRWTFMAP